MARTKATNASLKRRRSERKPLSEPCDRCATTHHDTPLSRATSMHDHQLVPEILLSDTRPNVLTHTSDGRDALDALVSNGYALIIQQLIAAVGPEPLSDRAWNEHSSSHVESGVRDRVEQAEPLLSRACKRTAPNMSVVRVLVEQAGHDVTAQQHSTETPYPSQGFHHYQRNFPHREIHVKGECALHALVRGGHWWQINEGLPYLLEKGADTEVRDIYGMTPLSAALERYGWLGFDRRAAELFVQHGADVNAVDRSGYSCLAKACPDIATATLLLNYGAIVTQKVFIQATLLKDLDLLALFLCRGADPNHQEERTTTLPSFLGKRRVHSEDYYVLHFVLEEFRTRRRCKSAADEKKFRAIVSLLLEHGANPCAKYNGTTILHELVRDNHDIRLLLDSNDCKVDLEVLDDLGRTPLMLACDQPTSPHTMGQHDAEGRSTMDLLLQRGANIRTSDHDGNNIWHILAQAAAGSAYASGDWKAVASKAPDLINAANKAGATPLHKALESSFLRPKVDLLLECGADTHAVNNEGAWMLHVLMRNRWHVSEHGDVEGEESSLFSRLLTSGVDVNLRDKAGETPIFSFVRHGSVGLRGMKVRFSGSVVQPVWAFFTESGVDWQVVNNKGQNLLHLVASTRPPIASQDWDFSPTRSPCDMFKTLVNMGLDAGLEDRAGRTPLDIAADLGHLQILDLYRAGTTTSEKDRV